MWRIFGFLTISIQCLAPSVAQEVAECSPRCWIPVETYTEIDGAEFQSGIGSEEECKALCLNTEACIGANWNRRTNECWLATNASSTSYNPDMNYWSLANCTDDCASYCWKNVQIGAHVSPGYYQPNITDENYCKLNCSNTPTCTGIEWTGNCNLLDPAGSLTNYSGERHWEIKKNLSTICLECSPRCWNPVIPDTAVNGARFKSGVGSEEECKALCLNTQACIGANWETDTNECFIPTAPWSSFYKQNVNYWSLANCTDDCAPYCWTLVQIGEHLFPGYYQPNITDENFCKLNCSNTPNCIGIEWMGICYLLDPAGSLANYSGEKRHWEIKKNLPTNCQEDPFIFSTDLTTASIVSSTVDSTTDNPCYPSPCRNGATCIENGHNFSCICVPGFTGQNCSVEINECESSPCYPFGKCTDLIGDYNCSCNPGYEPLPNNTKTCTETDFCAKETQPCFNGGTCVNQNALSRYYCLCPVLDGKQYVGLLCETELITKPIVNGGISPTSGIIAGGANVTIRGQGMNVFEPLGAYLIDTTSSPMPSLYAYVIPNLTLSDSITVRVPPAQLAYVDRNLLMIVEYTGPINVTSEAENLRFKYTGNPVITAIEPTEILVLGGVHLTVSGSNMDTVQKPMMDITTFVVNKTTGNSETNYSRESCSLKNASAITCLVPHGIVPSSFFNNTMPVGKSRFGVVHLESSFRHKRGSRRRKRAPVANLTDEAGSTFEMYLGFIFDEYPTYNNISKSLPHVTLTLVSPLVNFTPGSSVDFVSNKMETISLKGSGFTYGCSMGDYQVLVSNAPCNVTSLTDNELQCRPPKEEPPINDSSSFCVSASDPHPVKVFIGGETHLGCCLSYTTDYTDIIIGVTVTCVVVVAIIILVAVLVYMRHRNSLENDLTILTFLRKKLFHKGDTLQRPVKRDNIFVNSDAPPELVEEAIDHAVNANRRQTDERQPKEETNSKIPAAGPDYLVAYDDDAVSRRNRSNVGVNPGKQTTAVEIVPTRRYPTGIRSAELTDDDYLQPRDGQMMFNSNDGIDDNIGDSSGRTREKYGHVDDISEPSIEENGTRPISEQGPGYLILFDTEDTRPINEPDIDYLILHDTEGSRPISEPNIDYLIVHDTEGSRPISEPVIDYLILHDTEVGYTNETPV